MTLALGLVGCGVMGRRHVLGMKRLQAAGRLSFELAAVCDLLPDNAAAPGRYGRGAAGPAARQVCRGRGHAASRAAGRHHHHHDARDPHRRGAGAFAAGVDVLAEKPITLSVADGLRLVRAAREAGRTLGVAENYRRDPINRLGQALVAGKK